MAQLALQWVATTRRASDQFARVHFDDTVIDYRDDNRHLWRFIEAGDEEESFDLEPRSAEAEEVDRLPPRLYPEWDEATQTYRPDWVSVYDLLHPAGDAAVIDRLLARHAGLARELKRWLDLLKPQDRVRLRYQEEGSELDLDVAVRVLKPSLPIRPGIVEVKTGMQSQLGKLLLSNSITLTPGTLTLDVQGDRMFIHWIDVKGDDIDSSTAAIVSVFERTLKEVVE